MGAHVLAHLGVVDVDVDEGLGPRRPFVELGGDAVVDPHPDHHQKVGVLDRAQAPAGAHEAGHVQRQRVLGGEGADAQQRGADGDAGLFGQLQELGLGAAQEHAVADQDHRPLGLGQLAGDQPDCRQVGLQGGPVTRHGQLVRVVEDATGLLDVLADIDQHRPGPAGGGQVEGLADAGSQVFDSGDQVVVLGDRQRAPDHVRLLEGVAADDRGVDLARDGDHRHRVHEGRGQAGDQVQGARPAGREDHSWLAGGARVAVGHVCGALLVADQDVAQRGVLGQPLVDGQVGAAGVPEDDLDAFPLERAEDDVRPGHHVRLWFGFDHVYRKNGAPAFALRGLASRRGWFSYSGARGPALRRAIRRRSNRANGRQGDTTGAA